MSALGFFFSSDMLAEQFASNAFMAFTFGFLKKNLFLVLF